MAFGRFKTLVPRKTALVSPRFTFRFSRRGTEKGQGVTLYLEWQPRGWPHPNQQEQEREKQMKKLLLIALVASGLLFVPMPRSEAGVWVGGGYYFPYSGYGYYRPYYGTFYQPYS